MIIFEGKQLIEMQGFGGKYHEKASAQAGFDTEGIYFRLGSYFT